MGSAEQEPVPDTRGVQPPGPGSDDPELWSLAQKPEDHVLVLGAIEGAGRIDEPPPGTHEPTSTLEDVALNPRQLDQHGGVDAEPGIRPAPQRAQLRARSIHEYAVGEHPLWRSAEHLDMREPGAGAPLHEPVEALGIHVVGEEPPAVLHGGAELKRLATGPGAQVEHGLPGPGLDEEAEELTALVLHLEEALAEGGEPIEVGPGADDMEREGAEGTGPGLDALGAQPLGQGFTGGPQRVHPERDGAGDIEVGAEVLGGGAELPGEVVGEPVRQGVPEGERRGLALDEGERSLKAHEPGGLLGGETDEPVEEGVEQRGRGRLGETQVEAEPTAPEADVEDGLGEDLALLAGEVAVGTQGAVQDALSG